MRRPCAIVLLLVVLAALIASCGPSWEVGDQLVSELEMELIRSWNEPSIIKTVSCHLQENEHVEVVEGPTEIWCGANCKETTMAVGSLDRENCYGWVSPGNMDDFHPVVQ